MDLIVDLQIIVHSFKNNSIICNDKNLQLFRIHKIMFKHAYLSHVVLLGPELHQNKPYFVVFIALLVYK